MTQAMPRKKTLLEQAFTKRRTKIELRQERELTQLAVAWFRSEIGVGDVARTLKVRYGSNIYSLLAGALKRSIQDSRVLLEVKS